MLPPAKKELKRHRDPTACYICGKRFPKKFAKNKNYQKGRNRFHFTDKYGGESHSIWNLRINVSNENSVVFWNVWNYDYHFIIKELANKFEG